MICSLTNPRQAFVYGADTTSCTFLDLLVLYLGANYLISLSLLIFLHLLSVLHLLPFCFIQITLEDRLILMIPKLKYNNTGKLAVSGYLLVVWG